MTEEEWLSATDPAPMLEFLKGRFAARKFVLFGVACVSRAWNLLTDERCRNAVGTVEAFVEGSVERAAWRQAYEAAHAAYYEVESRAADFDPEDAPDLHRLSHAHFAVFKLLEYRGEDACEVVARNVRQSMGDPESEPRVQVGLVRDIFGNPFRRASVAPSWLASTVIQLGAGIYDGRDFSALPILADALQDAGCEDEGILTHLRGSGPHVRGCWALDVVLGKE